MYAGDVDPWRVWPPAPDAVAAAQSGDERVITAIAAAAIPKLVAFYRGLGMRSHDAEDLAGDACEAVVRTFPRLRDPARFEAWFWKVARSKFYDHLRKSRRAPQALEREAMYDDPSDALVVADEHSAIRVAFGRLKVRDREVLWLRDVLGLAYEDISGRMRMKEGAIRIAVMRARQRLEQALDEVEERR
jgi:RNA polymerase sigma-70 factor (ECF subfamily)